MNTTRVNLPNGLLLGAALILLVLGMAAPHIAEARPASTKAQCNKLVGTAKTSCWECVAAGGKYENYKCKKKDGTTVECNLFDCNAKVKAQLTPSPVAPLQKKQTDTPGRPIGTIGRGKRSDLVPRLTHPMSGKIVVRNIGNAPAGKTKLTLSCDKLPGNGHCPPGNTIPSYEDPAFPNRVVVQVPALAPGASYTHTLSFWSQLQWPPGRYKFVATADASGAEAERNEANNVVSSLLRAK